MEKRTEVINPAIFLNCLAFLGVMKIGDIAYKIYEYALLGMAGLGVVYLIAASSSTCIQERKYNFGNTVEVRGVEVTYQGREPYKPWLPHV